MKRKTHLGLYYPFSRVNIPKVEKQPIAPGLKSGKGSGWYCKIDHRSCNYHAASNSFFKVLVFTRAAPTIWCIS